MPREPHRPRWPDASGRPGRTGPAESSAAPAASAPAAEAALNQMRRQGMQPEAAPHRTALPLQKGSPMTHLTLPAPEHAHRGGSVGGPGENSAECVCGVTFDGFDTHREAMTVLTQHVKDETKTKPAGLLESGDWIDASSFGPDFEGPAEVRYIETYEDLGWRQWYSLLVVSGGVDPQPSTIRGAADRRVRLLTAAEIEKVKAEERRERLARQFEQLAEFARRGDIPFPASEQLHFTLDTRAEVEAVAKALGLQTAARWGDGLQVSWPHGAMSYDEGLYVLWHTAEKAPAVAEPVPAVDDQGFGYSRELDDDPQVIRPHSPRLPLHTGAVVDGGQLVDETPASGIWGPLVHLGFRGHIRCGIAAAEHGDSTTISPAKVTCPTCRDAANLADPSHFLEPGAGDGDLTDVLACGLTIATSGEGGYVTDADAVTCAACRVAALLDEPVSEAS
jgi:hypothetical protein